MPICPVKHQKDQTLPVRTRYTAPGTGNCNITHWLLKLSPGRSHCSTFKPLQMIQNAAARLVFNQPKTAHVTPLLISLHWLPVAARIKFKSLTLAYKAATKAAPAYLNSLIQVYTPSRSLRSAKERRLALPSQNGPRSRARLFSSVVPRWWNELPNSIRSAESLSIFKKRLKTQLFHEYLRTWWVC